MKFRRFGGTGWQVGEIGYGMWGMAGWTGSQDAESLASLQRAIDLGCDFFDTAWAYGNGHSEELLGKALRANPSEKLYVATKLLHTRVIRICLRRTNSLLIDANSPVVSNGLYRGTAESQQS